MSRKSRIKLQKMKIFSQSTACAFVAVANGLSFARGADPDWETTRWWLCQENPGSPWCLPANPRPIVRKEFQLYGGWDLPVPQFSDPNLSINRDPNYPRASFGITRGCSMSHLPKRGETGRMKLVNCGSDEIQRFKDGNGPTGFTGFFSDKDYSGYRREECYLVKDGKFIRLMNSCQSAVENNDSNRFIQEDLSPGITEETRDRLPSSSHQHHCHPNLF